MSLTSVAAPIWNEIAKTQRLRTRWARRVFLLPTDQAMAEEEGREYKTLKRKVGPEVAMAFQDVKPLLLENVAISRFTLDHPELRQALPEIVSVAEAVIIASKDRPLSQTHQKLLARLLRAELT